MEVLRANPDICWDGKTSHRQLMKKNPDGHENPPLCAMGGSAYWYIGNPSYLKKKKKSDVARLHPV